MTRPPEPTPMPEGELLDHIYGRTAASIPGVLVGPGDDCALVEAGEGRVLIAVDQLIAGRHFDPADTPLDLVARKAIARNVSDIAAMAGTPLYTLCAACLPEGFARADELFDRMHAWATRFGCPLVGGDIARSEGPLALGVTIVGSEHAERGAVLRSGARAGDCVFVTGPLGASYETGWHLRFEPRVETAQRLASTLGERLHAMIDLSDGLGLDGARVAQASGVHLELEAEAIPVREGAAGWREATRDGEDYELLLCAEVESIDGCVRIGRVVAGEGCVVIASDGVHDVSAEGWEHA